MTQLGGSWAARCPLGTWWPMRPGGRAWACLYPYCVQDTHRASHPHMQTPLHASQGTPLEQRLGAITARVVPSSPAAAPPPLRPAARARQQRRRPSGGCGGRSSGRTGPAPAARLADMRGPRVGAGVARVRGPADMWLPGAVQCCAARRSAAPSSLLPRPTAPPGRRTLDLVVCRVERHLWVVLPLAQKLPGQVFGRVRILCSICESQRTRKHWIAAERAAGPPHDCSERVRDRAAPPSPLRPRPLRLWSPAAP